MAIVDLHNYHVPAIMADTVAIISCCHNVSLLCLHSYYICPCFSRNRLHKLQIMSFFCLFMLGLLMGWGVFIAWNLYPEWFLCSYLLKIGLILWGINKVALYYLFLERLFSVFDKSALSFSKMQILAPRILLGLHLGIGVTLTGLYGNGAIIETNGQYHCRGKYPIWLNLYAAVGDFIICTVISIIFARRLLLLNIGLIWKKQELSKKDGNDVIDTMYDTMVDDSMWELLSKSTILSFVALFTTEISLICIGLLGWATFWGGINSMVDSWCIILMFVNYKRLYFVICGKLERLVTLNCLSCYSCDLCYHIRINAPKIPQIRRSDIALTQYNKKGSNISKNNEEDQGTEIVVAE